MTTSPDQVHGHQYVDFDEYIDIQLRKTGSTIKTTDVMTAVVGVLTLITLYLLLFVICDHWLVPGGIGPVARSVMLGVVGSIACVWMAIKVIVPWRRRVSGLYAASTIEKASPALKSSLINLVDISRSGHEVSPEIYQSIERRAALALTHVDVNETVDRRSLLRLSNALLGVVVLFCLYWIFSPKNPGTSLWRAMVPSSEVGVATRTEIFNVHPGDKDVLARSQLEVTADIRGELPQQTFLYFTTADRKFVDERVEMRIENEGTRKFRCVLTGDNGGGILQNMTYRIIAGDATTPEYKIRVIQPPAATIDSIRLDNPDYTHRESVTQTTGAIDALEGTRARLKANANMPLRSASLQFFDDESATKRAEEIPIMVTDGTKLQVDWKLEIRSDGTYPHYYRIFCTSTEGESDPSPSLYNYSIRPDQPPEITLRDPKTDLDLPSNAVLPLLIEARDPDFALTYIDLIIEKDGSPVPLQNVYSGNDQQFKTTYRWQFKDYQFRAKDTITYWLEAKDNRQPSANVSRTPKLRIHITAPVSEEQVKKQLAMAEQRQKDEAKTSEAEQPPQGKQDEDQSPENENKGQQPKQKKDKRQSGAGKQDPAKQQPGQGEPDKQPGEDGASNDQQAENSQNQKEQANQAKQSPDKDENQKLNPDNPADDAKALKSFNDMLNQKPKKPQPNPKSGGGGGDDSSPEQSASKQNQQPGPDKSDQDSQQPNPKQQQSPNPSQSQDAQNKPGENGETQHPSGDSKPENQPKGNEKPGESANHSRDQKDPNGQSPTPGDDKADSKGSKPQGKNGDGEKASDTKPDGGKPGANQDGSNPQQPKPQPGDQSQQDGQQNGSSKSSPDSKDKKDQKQAGGDRNSKGDQNSEKEKSNEKPAGSPSAKPNGTPDQSKQPGREKNSPDQANSKQDATKPDPGKNDQKQNGTPDKNTPPKNQEGASDSGNENQQTKQQKQDGDQSSTGKQPGDQTGNDPGSKKGAQNQSQNNQSQNSDSNSASNSGNKPGEDGKQKPSGKQDGSHEAGSKQSGQREKGSNEPGKKDATKEPGEKPIERGDGSPKESGEKNGQAPRKADREQNSQPNGGQAGKPNGEQQPQERSENNDAASGQDKKAAQERRDQRGSDNPVDAKTPESHRRRLDEQPNSVQDRKKRDGMTASETDPSRGSQPEGTGQEQTAEQRARQQEIEQRAGGKQQEGGAQQKPNGSPEKDGAREQKRGGKASGENGQPKPSDSNEGQPQSNQNQPGNPSGKGQEKGQPSPGKAGEKGSKGDSKEGASGSGQDGKGNQQSPSGKPGSKPGPGDGQSNAGHNGGGFNNGEGSGAGAPLEETKANIDYAKQATDLVLNKLENQLKRGKIDKKIEEEMGWNQDQVRRFVERMRKEAQAAQDPNSPGSEARRLQFEETLRTLNLRSTPRKRSNDGPKRADAEMGGTRSVPPPEYRDIYEAYTRSLAKPIPRQTDDKK